MTLSVVTGAPQPRPNSRLDNDVLSLFDYAFTHRDGFIRPEVQAQFGWSQHYFHVVERRLRELMATEKENLVCVVDEDNPKGPWLYYLTDVPELTDEWFANRLGDGETRLDTMINVCESATRRYDARTTLGKKARIMYTHAKRALEDLAVLDDRAV